jgi:hypothetical protein
VIIGASLYIAQREARRARQERRRTLAVATEDAARAADA